MIAILLPALVAGANPVGFQSTETLDRLVEQFAGAPVGMEGGARAPVDKRLKLAACDAPQLRVHDRHELAKRRLVALVPREQQLGDVSSPRAGQRMLMHRRTVAVILARPPPSGAPFIAQPGSSPSLNV